MRSRCPRKCFVVVIRNDIRTRVEVGQGVAILEECTKEACTRQNDIALHVAEIVVRRDEVFRIDEIGVDHVQDGGRSVCIACLYIDVARFGRGRRVLTCCGAHVYIVVYRAFVLVEHFKSRTIETRKDGATEARGRGPYPTVDEVFEISISQIETVSPVWIEEEYL